MNDDPSHHCPHPGCAQSLTHSVQAIMSRTEVIERILFGRAEENRPGLIERHNNVERIAGGIQRRLDQVLTAALVAIVAGVVNLYFINRSTSKLKQEIEEHPRPYVQPQKVDTQ